MRGTGLRARARPGGRSPWRPAWLLLLICLLSTVGSLGGRELALRAERASPGPEQAVREVSILASGHSARPYELAGRRRASKPVVGFVDGPPDAVRGFSPAALRAQLAAGPGESSRRRRARAGGTRRRGLSPARREAAPGYRAQLDGAGTASVAQAASTAVAGDRRLLVRVRRDRGVALHSRPGGRGVARVGWRTEFGSPLAMAVAKRRGRWLGVIATGQPNGRVLWVDGASPSLRIAATTISLVVDRSSRTLVVRRGRRAIRRTRVAVGGPATTTPLGRFTVTDKLAGGRFSTFYGCCILALSGVQPNLPPGWQGGNRIAIHGTNRPGSIGGAVTAGCLRAADGDLRRLMALVPLGATVIVRR